MMINITGRNGFMILTTKNLGKMAGIMTLSSVTRPLILGEFSGIVFDLFLERKIIRSRKHVTVVSLSS
jgi:hypothetical protein